MIISDSVFLDLSSYISLSHANAKSPINFIPVKLFLKDCIQVHVGMYRTTSSLHLRPRHTTEYICFGKNLTNIITPL